MPSDEQPIGPRLMPKTTQINRRPSLARVFTEPAPDDASFYHLEGEGEYVNGKFVDRAGSNEYATVENNRVEAAPEVRDRILDERDAEKGGHNLEKKQTQKSARSANSARDPNLVTWDGPDDPKNPMNWSRKQKWIATFLVSSFTLLSPISSTMISPSVAAISQEFSITNDVEQQILLSIFVLAYAVGPLFIGPLSETFGRIRVLQITNLVFLIFNTACGGCHSAGQMVAFRFLSGIGGSAPLVIGGGVLGDAWTADERGAAISVYTLMPLLGPAIGPICGAWLTERTTWRWGFYSVSIACALIQLNGIFFLRETYAPRILAKKAAQLRKSTGNHEFKTALERSDEKTFTKALKIAIARPFRLIFTQLIVQFLAVYMAFIYGLMYLVLSTFPLLWSGTYQESLGISGLNYISLGLGFWAGAQICAPLNDSMYRRLKNTIGKGIGRPEFRVPFMLPGTFLMPIGLLIYGWAAQYQTHWIAPNIGCFVFSMGCIVCFQCIQTYLIDAYTRYAASALAAATVMRSLFAFGFPLFAPYMYAKLGYGWGNTLLAFLGVGLGGPAVAILWFWGEGMRARSKFAAEGGLN